MGPRPTRRWVEQGRKYRSWTARQKIEFVLAVCGGGSSAKEVCPRARDGGGARVRPTREKLLEGGRETPAGKEERQARAGAAAQDQKLALVTKLTT